MAGAGDYAATATDGKGNGNVGSAPVSQGGVCHWNAGGHYSQLCASLVAGVDDDDSVGYSSGPHTASRSYGTLSPNTFYFLNKKYTITTVYERKGYLYFGVGQKDASTDLFSGETSALWVYIDEIPYRFKAEDFIASQPKGKNWAIAATPGLTEGQTHTLRLSEYGPPPDQPEPPVVEGEHYRLKVFWVAPDTPDFAPITRYRVRWKRDGSSWNSGDVGLLTLSENPDETSTIISNLSNGQKYQVQVSASSEYDWGPWSRESAGTPATVAPLPPADLTATRGDGQVTLQWIDGDNRGAVISMHQYRVRAGSGEFGPWTNRSFLYKGSSGTVYTHVAGLSNDTPYAFQLRSVNQGGPSAASNTVYLLGCPNYPGRSDLLCTRLKAASNSAGTQAGFANGNDPDVPEGHGSLDKTTFHKDRLWTIDEIVKSSDRLSVMLDLHPTSFAGRLDGVHLFINDTMIPLWKADEYVGFRGYWNDMPAGILVDGRDYTIRVIGHKPAPFKQSAPTVVKGHNNLRVTWDKAEVPSAPLNTAVTAYEVRWKKEGTAWGSAGSGHKYAISPHQTSFTITGLQNDQSYEVQVSSWNWWGQGSWSDSGFGTPGKTAPGPPANLRITGEFFNYLYLAWEKPADDGGYDITGYRMRYALPGAAWEYALAGVSATGSTTIDGVIFDLLTGETYTIQAQAKSSEAGYGAWSNAVTATPHTSGHKPGAVSDLAVSGQKYDRLTVGWTGPNMSGKPAVSRYDVRYRKTGAGDWTNVPRSASDKSTTHTITGLEPSASYQAQVRAVNSAAPGPWSASVTGTTAALPTEPPAPGGLTATPGDGQVTLSWTAGGTAATQSPGTSTGGRRAATTMATGPTSQTAPRAGPTPPATRCPTCTTTWSIPSRCGRLTGSAAIARRRTRPAPRPCGRTPPRSSTTRRRSP